MTYQHSILPENPQLELQVIPEVYGRVNVRYRTVDARFAHRDDWREVEHCHPLEVVDVVAAVAQGFLDDFEAQGLF